MARTFHVNRMQTDPQNPFAPPHLEHHEQTSELEHLPMMEDVQAHLLTKIHNEVVPQLRESQHVLEAKSSTPEQKRHAEHVIQALKKRYTHLEDAAMDCAKLKCDPWKFEGVIVDDLVRELMENTDPAHLNHLRGLLRAGSWWMHTTPQTNADALETLHRVRHDEENYWAWRIRHTNTAPQDSENIQVLELRRDQSVHALDAIESQIKHNVIGEALEPSVRTVDQLYARAWLNYKKLEAAHSAPNVILDLKHDTERLRVLRNFLYYRRLYPNQARASLEH